MPKKYSIDTIPTPPRYTPIGKFEIERGEDCINCGRCAIVCIYEVHKRQDEDLRCMAEPVEYRCKGCFSCIQECPRATLTIREGMDYSRLGDSYWTPEIISTNWYQAETGKIPVSGAGYRGPFSGEGFDSMWTDMSEIVRPTRDGIHGREYISTVVEIGRKLPAIKFDSQGEIASHIPPTLNVPLPIIFDTLPFGGFDSVYGAMAMAASYLDTFMIADADGEWFKGEGRKERGEERGEERRGRMARMEESQFVPYISHPSLHHFDVDWIKTCKMVELEYEDGIINRINVLKNINHGPIISVKVPFGDNVEGIVEELAYAGIEVIHLYADINGMAINSSEPLPITDMTQKVHRHLVELKIRDDVTLIVSGGIAMAEHVAKAIICGADLTAIDLPLLFALECRYCKECLNGQNASQPCPIELKNVDPKWGAQRIINLIGAWRNQLLEILGAMGLREVRRLRGEVGRAIFLGDIEKDTFDNVFAMEESYDANG